MKFDWRVVWGAIGISVLIVIGSYFGSHWLYQLDEEPLNDLPTISNTAVTPIDSHPKSIDSFPTVRETYPDSELELVTSDEEVSFEATEQADAIATAEPRQIIRETLDQLRVKKEKLEAEIDQVSTLRTELANQSILDFELLNSEVTSKELELENEINQLVKIIETKLGTNPTLEECRAIEEWHQMRELARQQDGGLNALVSLDNSYHQESKEIAQKEAELFDERLKIMGRIKDLELQLAAE